MANSTKNSVGQFHRIIARIEFAGLLPVPNNLQNKLEFARVPFVSPEDLGIEEYR